MPTTDVLITANELTFQRLIEIIPLLARLYGACKFARAGLTEVTSTEFGLAMEALDVHDLDHLAEQLEAAPEASLALESLLAFRVRGVRKAADPFYSGEVRVDELSRIESSIADLFELIVSKKLPRRSAS